MLWWAVGVGVAVLVAAPIVVRLRTGQWGNGKAKSFSEIRNTPYAKDRQRRANCQALSLLVLGFPLGALLCLFCDWMNYRGSVYVPIVLGIVFMSSRLLGSYFYARRLASDADKA
jgi:hypothetical protein